ncbi:ACT domain-containing protein [Propionivibrio sp.]|uniref:ACT domain-containing protein n=1 Tax=Propionivibrio sp. TaxID=2212460 RepID=UPI00262EB18F|nr:ACT domain-containing protein [Propionivibrio sp.]
MIIKQISIFMENTMGRLADVTALLAGAGINLRALSIADTAEFGILRMVADQPDMAVQLLKDAGFTARETDVIGIEVPDRPGELARIMALFRTEGVNIEYLYASLEHQSDKAVIILKVDDINAGLAILEDHGFVTNPSF